MNTRDIFKQIRKNEKMTQKELGSKIGLPQGVISEYENNRELSISKLCVFLEKLGYSLEIKKLKKDV